MPPMLFPPNSKAAFPVHTPGTLALPGGASCSVRAVHTSQAGLYRAPVLTVVLPASVKLEPPQNHISLPVHKAVTSTRLAGALFVDIGFQESVAGSYRPPVDSVGWLP